MCLPRTVAVDFESWFGQQFDARRTGEHGEQAAHEEHRHLFRVVSRVFQRFDTLARRSAISLVDPGGFARRVQVLGVGPDAREPLADFRAAEVFQIDAERLAVGELRVVFPLAGEVGIGLDHMADVADQDEGRPAVVVGSALA